MGVSAGLPWDGGEEDAAVSERRALRSAVPSSHRHRRVHQPRSGALPGWRSRAVLAKLKAHRRLQSDLRVRLQQQSRLSSFVTFFYFLFFPRGYFQNRSLITAVNGTKTSALSLIAKLKEKRSGKRTDRVRCHRLLRQSGGERDLRENNSKTTAKCREKEGTFSCSLRTEPTQVNILNVPHLPDGVLRNPTEIG